MADVLDFPPQTKRERLIASIVHDRMGRDELAMSFFDKKQPPRADTDGPVSVESPHEGTIIIRATTNGTERMITMSRYNAWRVFGALSLMLGIKLPKKLGEGIKL